MKPKRTTLNYLIGWFKVETKGNHRAAKKRAIKYRQGLGETDAR